MSRRQLLETGLRLGLASPVILSLIEAAPEIGRRRRQRRRDLAG